MIAMITLTALSVFYKQEYGLLNLKLSEFSRDTQKQIHCLAENIYYEAGYEPKDGQMAVALVTLNRVQDPRFPKDICGVVKQKTASLCQFSWFCEPRKSVNERVYKDNLEVALFVYANYENLSDLTNGAKYYHADYVNPHWRGLEKTTKIGRHIFYKEKDNDVKTESTTKGRAI
jgi:spore germination cell wall hydrolase CwlJ-like protein